ncbi:MAG: glycoside hydrolase family 3 C-terminal domain-containing protein [Candidatus Latescibacteria bacterium]|nr:glycoside hydrolase family 3 C-terminal domain-containing protein [Candidatus Latescibacterota bacterium]
MNKRYTPAVGIPCLVLVCLALLVPGGCEKEQESKQAPWVDSTFSSMTEQEKIGQIFCLTVDPIRYFLYPEYKSAFNLLVGKYQPGAIFVSANLDTVKMEIRHEFNGNKLHDEILKLQEISDIPVFVAANFESGAWYWDYGATRFPNPLALAASQSPEHSYRQGKITAVEAKTQGFNWLLSPVVNLSIELGNNSLIAQSLGSDPATVADLGPWYIKGCQEVGIAACMKYFPSEIPQAVVDIPPGDLDQAQLDVFRAGIETGVLTIMTSPLDESFADQASETHTIQENLRELLQNRLGFKGVVLSEFRTSFDSEKAVDAMNTALEAVDAGTTMFLLPETFSESIPVLDVLFNETLAGKIDMKSIDAAVRKNLAVKDRINLSLAKSDHSLRAMAGMGMPEYYESAQELSNMCITLLKNDDDILPIDPHNTYIFSISFFDELASHYTTLYSEKLDQYAESLIHLNIFGKPDQRVQFEVERRAKEADVVVCSFFRKISDDPETPTITPDISSLMDRIVKANDSVVVLCFADPFLINQLPEIQGYLVTYSPSKYSIEAAVNVLFGKSGPKGVIPVSISDEFPAGAGLTYTHDPQPEE